MKYIKVCSCVCSCVLFGLGALMWLCSTFFKFSMTLHVYMICRINIQLNVDGKIAHGDKAAFSGAHLCVSHYSTSHHHSPVLHVDPLFDIHHPPHLLLLLLHLYSRLPLHLISLVHVLHVSIVLQWYLYCYYVIVL